MSPFECVPNFSEGRDTEKVERIAEAARSVANVTVLDIERNADHNRCVITLYGDGDPLVEAVLAMMRVATELIDLTQHRGEHPRMGATDVVPFIPLGSSTMPEAVRLAERLGERVGLELGIPVYLYAQAARRPERSDLAKVREGQFEGLRDAIVSDPARAPDFGPGRLHPTAGAVAIGARPILIAYNVYLDTPDVAVAKKVAKAVRARDGGLPEVKALGFEIRERNLAQVSMNLTDYRVTPVPRAFDAVRRAAERSGVGIVESEVVGLIPEDALLDAAEQYLILRSFDRGTILERKVRTADATRPGRESIAGYAARVAARTPTPGGGSVAAVAAALAAALGEMVIAYSIGRASPAPALVELQATLTELRARLLLLAELDPKAYDRVVLTRRALKDQPEDPAARQRHVEALRGAVGVPLETARIARDLADRLEAVRSQTKSALVSDLVTALSLLRAAVQGALANVDVNLVDLKATGETVAPIEEEVARLRAAR